MNNKKKSSKIIKKILIFRARGYSLQSIGGIFGLSRERIRQIIKKNEDKKEFQNLYEEIRRTQRFLRRKIKT